MGSARRLVGGAAGLVASAAKHALWYLSYQVGGRTRDDPSHARKAEDRT